MCSSISDLFQQNLEAKGFKIDDNFLKVNVLFVTVTKQLFSPLCLVPPCSFLVQPVHTSRQESKEGRPLWPLSSVAGAVLTQELHSPHLYNWFHTDIACPLFCVSTLICDHFSSARLIRVQNCCLGWKAGSKGICFLCVTFINWFDKLSVSVSISVTR